LRKVMLLAAMLAMVLAAAAPVLAQDVNVETGDTVEYNAVCQNIAGEINAINANTANADADAEAGDDAAAIAEIAQDNDLTVAQVNECLNNFVTVTATHTPTGTVDVTVVPKKKVIFIEGKKFWVIEGKTVTATATATSSASASATASATSSATASATALPETGGLTVPSGFALGAGALLVAGGLLARRIVR